MYLLKLSIMIAEAIEAAGAAIFYAINVNLSMDIKCLMYRKRRLLYEL